MNAVTLNLSWKEAFEVQVALDHYLDGKHYAATCRKVRDQRLAQRPSQVVRARHGLLLPRRRAGAMSTAEEVRAWAQGAEPGARWEYWTGHLARDREDNPELDEAAAALMQLAEEGFCELTQHRVGEGACVYLATRTGELMG